MKFDAIILAAGRGKRMKPFSDVISKPMLPLLNKPLVAIISEQLLRLGAEKIVLTVSPSNIEEFQKYFQKQIYSSKILYCLQDPPLGTADAIFKAGSLCTSEVIYSMAGDNLFSENFCKKMVDEYFKQKKSIHCIIALMEVTREEITKLASVTLTDTGLITNIVEKPKLSEVTSTLASLSMYIFDKKLLKHFGSVPLSARGEYEAPDALLSMIDEKENIKIQGMVTREEYVHISDPKDLWRYNMEYLEKETNFLADGITMGKNVSIKHCVVGGNSKIGDNCILENSLILENATIPANSIIQKCVVGSSEKGIEKVSILEGK